MQKSINKVEWEDQIRATQTKRRRQSSGVTYKTQPKDGFDRLQIRVYKGTMKAAGWKAGDRVKIVSAKGFDHLIGLALDPDGYKLCPQPEGGESYDDALGQTRTCFFNVQITPADGLGLTGGKAITATDVNFSQDSGVLAFTLPKAQLTQTKNTENTDG